ncbi:MAG: T9SS type A sorting domain-containing protein [Flavobacteriaceae bacterium]|tara:strand:- start:5164 stop:6450 length:1287 start_codon:yes stop_codon:yes gene_type:complete
MIKKILNIVVILYSISSISQIILPIDFENNQITTDDFVNFDGGVGSATNNPYINDQNPSSTIGQIIRDGGQVWAGSYLVLSDYLDFSSNTHISMSVYTPISGLTVKFKLEGDNGAQTERDTYTTLSNDWETLTWSFSGEPSNTYNKLVLMFDFGNVGDGSVNSTFYFDDITSFDPSGGLNQIDLPVTFEDPEVYYSVIDFEGNGPSTIVEEGGNHYVQVIKTDESGTSAGVTIGTEEGFATNIPITNSDTKMYAHVYVDGTAQIGIPVRFKIENSNDPTQSVETEAFTTVAGEWEILEFDFSNEATGTAALNTSYPFNMASIFFNFGSVGNNNIIYFFDNISFSSPISLSLENQEIYNYKIYPNPTSDIIKILGNTSVLNVIIYDVLGKELLRKSVIDKIDISSFEKGTYFISLSDGIINSSYKIIKN